MTNLKQFFTDPFGMKRIAHLESQLIRELYENRRLSDLLYARAVRMTELCDENFAMHNKIRELEAALKR